MRRLLKLAPPPVLAANASSWTAEYLFALTSGTRLPTRWQHRQIKEQLIAETQERCAYCDSAMLAISYGDIEHMLPRSHRPELVVTWTNLTLACSRCNGAKGDYYNDETPLLSPYDDDPREHLTFLGELVFVRNASERGMLTIHKLQLSRPQLAAARARRLSEVSSLLQSWKRSSGDVQDVISEMIIENIRTGEYLHSVLPLLVENSFPTSGLIEGS